MEITLDTKIYDLLKNYPFLEDKLIKLNPKYKKLKNPILKRTVARVASIKQAAIVGGMDPVEVLNFIRKEVGLEPVFVLVEESKEEVAPIWITNEPKKIFDANELLNEGKNPLAEILKTLKEIDKDDIILLKADFKPEPLIDELKKKGYEIYCSKIGENEFLTYIKK